VSQNFSPPQKKVGPRGKAFGDFPQGKGGFKRLLAKKFPPRNFSFLTSPKLGRTLI